MKLSAIRMINSGNFIVANLLLDADSIQLAGRNNSGKTSLLWTLPLLFVVDRTKITYPEYGSKETLHYYLKEQERSYIVFEGFDEKQGYFYMLLKRDGEQIKYYFVQKQFKEEYLIQDGKVLPFHTVLENPHTGLGAPMRDVGSVLSRVVSSKSGEVGFLRLENKVSSKRFADLYMHLFRTNTKDNILKNGILVVLGLKDEKIDFGNDIGHEDKASWNKERREIESLKKIKAKIDRIKEKRDEYGASKVGLSVVLSPFTGIDFDLSLGNIGNEKARLGKILKEQEDKIAVENETKQGLESDKSTLNREIGELGGKVKTAQEKLSLAISYGEPIWIKQEIKNKADELENTRTMLSKFEIVSTRREIESKLRRVNVARQRAMDYVNNNAELLFMNISENKGDIALAHTLLSDVVNNLSKDKISLLDSEGSETLTFKGVSIDTSSIVPDDIPTKEEKELEIKELDVEISLLEEMLANVDKISSLRESFKIKSEEHHELKNKLMMVESMSETKKLLNSLEKSFAEQQEKEKGLRASLKEIEDNVFALTKLGVSGKKEIVELSSAEDSISEFRSKFVFAKNLIAMDVPKAEGGKILTASEMLTMIKGIDSQRQDAVRDVEGALDSLNRVISDTKSELRGMDDILVDEPSEFIKVLESKCYGVEIREKELGELMRGAINIFYSKIKNFLLHLEAVRAHVKKVNKIISQYSISNLSSVSVVFEENKEQISKLQGIGSENIDLFFDTSFVETGDEDDFIKWIRTEKVFSISELFNIALEVEKDDKKKSSNQSNGTNKMLHVMLLLLLMRDMVNKEDTIPFLIDEVADIDAVNQVELLAFFKELNLLPISASPSVSHNFEKIYRIESVEGRSFVDDETSTRKISHGEDTH